MTMNKKWLKWIAAMLLMLLMTVNSVSVLAATAISSFTYILDDAANTITLEKYNGSETSVTVSGSYELDEKIYNTVIDSDTIFKGNKKIESVTLETGVSFADQSMAELFNGCTALSAINLSQISTAGVTDMTRVFNGCSALKNLDVSSFDTSSVTSMREMFSNCSQLVTLTGYQSWKTGSLTNTYLMFNGTKKFTKTTTIDLSQWDMDQIKVNDWMFQECKAGTIILPENLSRLGAGFMNKASYLQGTTITIPSGVQYGGRGHLFYNVGGDAGSKFVEFKVAEGNKSLKAIDGVLYSKDGKWLLSVPRYKKYSGVIEIPEGVVELGEMSLAMNKNYTKVILPNTFNFRQFVPTYAKEYGGRIDDMGTSNLNWANNLSIAFYAKYTNIAAYEVKPTNKKYKTVDGILYSKDMKSLLAIAIGYGKDIVVPEGVTTWETFAIWAGASDIWRQLCTGVSIPSTMEYIAHDQVDSINQLYKNRKDKGFKITVAEGCEYYGLDEEGFLICKKIPKRCSWLMEDTFQYDGTPKEPEVKVSLYMESIKDDLRFAYDIWGASASEREFLSYLTEGVDYTVEYINNIEPGSAIARIHGLGQYTGTVIDLPFRIIGVPNVLPSTGDESHLITWVLLMMMSMVALCMVSKKTRKA